MEAIKEIVQSNKNSLQINIPSHFKNGMFEVIAFPMGESENPQPRLETCRPKVGTITSRPVSYSDDAFKPLQNDDLADWGLAK
jgi:hypothetical protein